MTAYPHLPVGNDSAWLCQVPLIAHHVSLKAIFSDSIDNRQNEYLMHAILGLAASHLELTTGTDLRSTAIHHRLLAIKGSNDALTRTHRSGSDADALLASCYALTYQSTYMRDGLSEFFQMVRGCSLLSDQFKAENIPMAFFLEDKNHFQYMEDKLLDLPVISKELVDGAERSLVVLPPLFSQPSHVYFYQLLMAVIERLKLSSLAGKHFLTLSQTYLLTSPTAYFKFIMVYQGILKMEGPMFQEFLQPENTVSRILIAHFLAIEMIMMPILDREHSGRARTTPARAHLDWVSMLHMHCSVSFRKYMEWPVAVKNCVNDELEGKERVIPTVSILRKKEGLSKNLF
jgi:hypothetical protein